MGFKVSVDKKRLDKNSESQWICSVGLKIVACLNKLCFMEVEKVVIFRTKSSFDLNWFYVCAVIPSTTS